MIVLPETVASFFCRTSVFSLVTTLSRHGLTSKSEVESALTSKLAWLISRVPVSHPRRLGGNEV